MSVRGVSYRFLYMGPIPTSQEDVIEPATNDPRALCMYVFYGAYNYSGLLRQASGFIIVSDSA